MQRPSNAPQATKPLPQLPSSQMRGPRRPPACQRVNLSPCNPVHTSLGCTHHCCPAARRQHHQVAGTAAAHPITAPTPVQNSTPCTHPHKSTHDAQCAGVTSQTGVRGRRGRSTSKCIACLLMKVPRSLCPGAAPHTAQCSSVSGVAVLLLVAVQLCRRCAVQCCTCWNRTIAHGPATPSAAAGHQGPGCCCRGRAGGGCAPHLIHGPDVVPRQPSRLQTTHTRCCAQPRPQPVYSSTPRQCSASHPLH
jgi:hypothetical protein